MAAEDAAGDVAAGDVAVAPEFSRPLSLRDVEEREHITRALEATEGECAALVSRFGILGMHSLEAEAEVFLTESETLVVKGRFSASVVQQCSVTLEPFDAVVENTIDERFFLNPEDLEDAPEDEDMAAYEILEGDAIDLGEIIAQCLSLYLDPYPRKPDAVLPETAASDKDTGGPFAGLSELLKPDK